MAVLSLLEGLGNSKDGFHPIHQRIAGFHASQCGFCTPGMCMSLFSALANAEKGDCSQGTPGFSNLTSSEAERAISGNLCWCTGYRPIADVCKSFAADVDLEDLGLNTFWRKGDAKDIKASKLPAYNPKNHVSRYTDVLGSEFNILNAEQYSWYTPLTIGELQSLLNSEMVKNGAKIKLVVGNTGDGYLKETEKYSKYIDLRQIPELSAVKKHEQGIEFGAALPISKVILHLKEEGKPSKISDGELTLTRIAEHMEKIASGFIRNSASLGGNLVMAQRKHFPSDIATLLLVMNSSISILSGHRQETITFEEFLYGPPLDLKDVLLNVYIPYPKPKRLNGSIQENSKVLFDSYRAAPRPLGNALPYLNVSLLVDVSCKESGILVNHVRLAFGAYGTKHALRVTKVEEYLAGKVLSIEVLEKAVKLVKGAVVPEDGTSYPTYRTSLAVGFLFSFLINLIEGGSSVFGGGLYNASNGSLLEENAIGCKGIKSNPIKTPTLLSSAKFGAAIQASGEAVYVDDIPSPPNCLHGTLICSTKPVARVKGISFNSTPQPTGVAALITVNDIPKGGENIGGIAFCGGLNFYLLTK